mmetsp:Transcript_15356/g.35940  ORF Transcript_15356/g.35940 Transcript_15356/m.35940 type:complete len:82 (-) Transcript_15356:391-636(-)
MGACSPTESTEQSEAVDLPLPKCRAAPLLLLLTAPEDMLETVKGCFSHPRNGVFHGLRVTAGLNPSSLVPAFHSLHAGCGS